MTTIVRTFRFINTIKAEAVIWTINTLHAAVKKYCFRLTHRTFVPIGDSLLHTTIWSLKCSQTICLGTTLNKEFHPMRLRRREPLIGPHQKRPLLNFSMQFIPLESSTMEMQRLTRLQACSKILSLLLLDNITVSSWKYAPAKQTDVAFWRSCNKHCPTEWIRRMPIKKRAIQIEQPLYKNTKINCIPISPQPQPN